MGSAKRVPVTPEQRSDVTGRRVPPVVRHNTFRKGSPPDGDGSAPPPGFDGRRGRARALYRRPRSPLRITARILTTSPGANTRMRKRGGFPHRRGCGKTPAVSSRWYCVSEIRSFRQTSQVSSRP
jgi:hypothetical protein